jgi:hypothetical protein
MSYYADYYVFDDKFTKTFENDTSEQKCFAITSFYNLDGLVFDRLVLSNLTISSNNTNNWIFFVVINDYIFTDTSNGDNININPSLNFIINGPITIGVYLPAKSKVSIENPEVLKLWAYCYKISTGKTVLPCEGYTNNCDTSADIVNMNTKNYDPLDIPTIYYLNIDNMYKNTASDDSKYKIIKDSSSSSSEIFVVNNIILYSRDINISGFTDLLNLFYLYILKHNFYQNIMTLIVNYLKNNSNEFIRIDFVNYFKNVVDYYNTDLITLKDNSKKPVCNNNSLLNKLGGCLPDVIKELILINDKNDIKVSDISNFGHLILKYRKIIEDNYKIYLQNKDNRPTGNGVTKSNVKPYMDYMLYLYNLAHDAWVEYNKLKLPVPGELEKKVNEMYSGYEIHVNLYNRSPESVL